MNVLSEKETDPALRSLEIKERAREIKEQARALGFHKVGIAGASVLEDERERLREWLARGYQAEMRWMEREPEKRTDPRLLFPAARSVVVLALNYYTPHEHEEHGDEVAAGPINSSGPTGESRSAGKISRYAWGDDYHDVMGEKLRALLAWIKERWLEAEGKACVDTAPLMDKAWAARAGLGWIGKHTNLITRDYGSWVFIGELLLNLELEEDAPGELDHCGSCTLCLESCPTGAIIEPYVVDSNRCISYATIELRAPELPATFEGRLDGWLYGCDVCQDVCPWNRFEQPTDERRFEPREGKVAPALDEILQLTPETYAERFRRSAIKRAKLAGLQRNARQLLEEPRAHSPHVEAAAEEEEERASCEPG